MRSIRSLALLSISLLTLAAACAPSAEDTGGDGDESALAHGRSVLKVGVNSEPTAIDPHYSFIDTNLNAGKAVFEALYEVGPDKELTPQLAESGAPSTDDPKVWTFTLKRGVRFHSGQPFTKADVLCNFRRVLSYKLAAGGYAGQLSAVDMPATESLNGAGTDPLVLKVATKAPYPLLASDLAAVFLTSCASTEKATRIENEDPARDPKETTKKILGAFASGELADGTGPYKLARFVSLATDPENAKTTLVANDAYYGRKPEFAAVELIPVPDDARRIERLRDGELNVANAIPAARVAELESAGVHVEKTRGLRVMHMWMYQKDDGRQANAVHVPVRDDAGKTYPTPFASKSFREACARAIDKEQFVALLGGGAYATSQMLPEGRVGYLPGYGVGFDVAAARAALARAAAEPGFEFLKNKKLTITIHGPNDRYPKDKESLALVAKMWTDAFGNFDVGADHYAIQVVAKDEPKASYFANAKYYLAGFLGGGIANGHASSALQLYLVPGSPLNYGDYANDAVTAKYRAGTSTSTARESDAILTDALRLALDDFGVIPIFNPAAIWAVAPGYAYTPRADDLTLVYDVHRSGR